jgi:conjugative relaxase-like TrwC/TraI family protein
VPAFDVVLRPTKSVSILYALGDRATGRAVLAAHHAGLAEAVAYLDDHIGARRGHGGAEHVGGGGLLAVGFDHRTSRAGDPLLHSHLVVANRVQGPDGRWTALDGRDLYRHRRAADAVYRAAYQRALTRSLGVAWTAADRWGNREMQGVPEELLRAFSKRAEQIEAEVQRLEQTGRERTPKLVKWAVHATRKPKAHEAPETLYERWRAEAAERGIDADQLVRRVTGRVRDRKAGVSDATVAAVFDHLAGPEGLTAQASTFACEDVITALGAGLTGATRAELDALADRFLAERAVSVVADRALEERHWSTHELLGVEERLVAAAVDRAGERSGVASHETVRQALAAHPSLGADQAGMVRDVCQAGAGVQVVVGRPGTGKTFTLGAARHAWQLDGYRLLAAAPTGIATVSLEAERFEDVATVDRLLLDLDRGGERLDARTVLVVDEAGMVGSRKLTRLLEHAQQTRVKVVLVGDDRQLAAVDAGGGFRALRLRLGASELTENRRQLHAWERDAIELVRQGLVDQAVAAYREHGRVVATESKPAMTLALLSDWWAAYREAEQNPKQDVVVLAARRDEVDRLNTACQHVLARNGRLGTERLRVEDRQVAVGDQVVCGKNAIAQLGVANGSRGIVTGLDTKGRTLTLRLDSPEPRKVTLPRWYLDGRQPSDHNRRVDLAYATTGHRAQGLTRWRALVRITGREDGNWLTVQLSRAKQDTRLYATVGPEPQGPAELDLAERDSPDVYAQFASSLGRDGNEHLAIDTQSTPELRRLSTGEVRAERDRLRAEFDRAPRDRARELARATARREQADQALAAARQQPPAPRPPACFAGGGMTSRRPSSAPRWRWPSSRPTAPTTASSRSAATSSAGPRVWRATPTSAPPTGRWSASWRGGVASAGWWSSTTGPATSASCSARFLTAPEAGGHGGRPLPRSRSTAPPTTSRIRSTRSAGSPATPRSRPRGGRPGARSGGSGTSSASPSVTARSTSSQYLYPRIAAPSRGTRGQAGRVRSGPPARHPPKEAPDGQPRRTFPLRARRRRPARPVDPPAVPRRPGRHPRPRRAGPRQPAGRHDRGPAGGRGAGAGHGRPPRRLRPGCLPAAPRR